LMRSSLMSSTTTSMSGHLRAIMLIVGLHSSQQKARQMKWSAPSACSLRRQCYRLACRVLRSNPIATDSMTHCTFQVCKMMCYRLHTRCAVMHSCLLQLACRLQPSGLVAVAASLATKGYSNSSVANTNELCRCDQNNKVCWPRTPNDKRAIERQGHAAVAECQKQPYGEARKRTLQRNQHRCMLSCSWAPLRCLCALPDGAVQGAARVHCLVQPKIVALESSDPRYISAGCCMHGTLCPGHLSYVCDMPCKF
jgi:hypothetical protein